MTAQRGGGLGEHLSRILAETITKATEATGDAKAETTRRHVDGWLEEAEDAYRPLIGPIVDRLANTESLPDSFRPLIEYMQDPEHQFGVVLDILGFLSAVLAAIFGLGEVEMQPALNDLWASFPNKPISPADLADMVERNIVGQDWAAGQAAKSGISADNFDLMVKDTGEPYGVDQALSLLRRGLITLERFNEVLYYSRVRNDFEPDVLLLANDTMTQGDAIEGALKGVIDDATAADLFYKAGGLPDQFSTLLDIAGNPIGVESSLNLLNHGLINEDQARQVILHSRINPIFEDMALLQRFRFLAPYQIVEAVKAGTATVEQGTEWLLAEGYPVDQVTAVLQASSKGATTTAKTISESQIATMFEAGAITEANATAMLVALGYHETDAAFILSVYDEKRRLSMVQAAINQVRKVFLAGRVDAPTAGTQLDALGVDPEAKAIYLTTWAVEAASELKELTAAQVGDSVKAQYITTDDATSRWEAMGYDPTDAGLLLAYYTGVPPVGSPAALAAAAAPAAPAS